MDQSSGQLVDDQLLQAMGLGALPEDKKGLALETTLELLNLKVARRVADQLSESQLVEFDQLMSGEPSKEQVAEWTQKNVPNFSQIVEEEAARLNHSGQATVDRIKARRAERLGQNN